MKKWFVTLLVLALILPSATAFAQSAPGAAEKKRNGMTKVWIGLGLAAPGVMLMSVSHRTASGLGSTASETNKGTLLTGAAMTGVGAYLMWTGWQDVQSAKKSPQIGIHVGKKSAAIAIRKSW